ncbi:3-oxoacyl-ACP synthase [Flavobacterium sp. Sd200]|uniref:3-oxoacyl-ACP synthase n=1 Tax=Flavobacterium sp. Sd200 TaxID=2692211 RepID=UPI00136DAC20|nr:3-oxoacyl-ACP synthase [Flavobacterium sp. Sd200]MXN90008.1 3-oxoacyl-ACP synthase [Flavobacterium sp. Sd200]
MAGRYYISGYCSIQDNRIDLNGQEYFSAPGAAFTDFAKQAYKHAETDYAKFFKMDNLSKLSFLAADLLLNTEANNSNTALLFANASSSLDTDVKYNESIADDENYFPSPAVFVYTLPNICLGEISIRHKLFTENSFFIFEEFNPDFFVNYATALLETQKADKVLCGWVEFFKDDYKAFMYLVSEEGTIEHTEKNIQTLYLS